MHTCLLPSAAASQASLPCGLACQQHRLLLMLQQCVVMALLLLLERVVVAHDVKTHRPHNVRCSHLLLLLLLLLSHHLQFRNSRLRRIVSWLWFNRTRSGHNNTTVLHDSFAFLLANLLHPRNAAASS
jgi:hypothetical protein